MSGRLQDRVMVITGGASGIGRASVLRFLEEGGKVVFGDFNLANGSRLQRELQQGLPDDRVRFYPCDVSLESDIVKLIDFARSVYGRIDAMVNNAGTGGALADLIDTSVEDWDRSQQVLLRGVFLGIKHAARAMIEQGTGGTIVNMASVTGLCGGAAGAAYATCKAGVINLTRVASVQLARHRIRVNCISPGTILTPLLTRDGDGQKIRDAALSIQPWPEVGEPEHIAPIVTFLCSDDSKFMTGENVVADGGMCSAGAMIYNSGNPFGEAVSDAIKESKQTGFDTGSTFHRRQRQPIGMQADDLMTADARRPRTIAITGVSRGLGRALADKLIAMGHTVVGCARSQQAVDELSRRYPAPHRFDVVTIGDEQSVRGWREKLDAAGLVPELILGNAALMHAPKQLWRFESREIEDVLRVNLMGTIQLLREFIPGMLRRKKGIVVNFSSGWGRETSAQAAPYCASKWGVEGLTRAVAKELPPFMATVSLHPGNVHTESMGASFGEAAELYPTPEEWAEVAVPFILGITPKDNGSALAIPGMNRFLGMGPLQKDRPTNEANETAPRNGNAHGLTASGRSPA